MVKTTSLIDKSCHAFLLKVYMGLRLKAGQSRETMDLGDDAIPIMIHVMVSVSRPFRLIRHGRSSSTRIVRIK